MSLLLRMVAEELKKSDENFNRDPRTSHLPLVGSPYPMIAICAVYFLFVTKWGPDFMEHRQPMNVKKAMHIYNLMQVLLNLFVFVEATRNSYWQPYFSVSCQEYNVHDTRQAAMNLRIPSYVFYISKYMDFFDTVFMVLRKNNRQVTFLHIYHHIAMVYAVWCYLTLAYGSHYTATGVINSLIHVLMYSYYFVASLKLNIDLAPYKRLMTQLQIVQFCCLSIHFARPIFNNWCGLDMFWAWMAFIQNFFMLVLFTDFYRKSYLKPKHI